MRYVILRDDDTNAFTPAECLDRLYRPFLERRLPVNLAIIPNVRTNAVTPEGKPEGFLFAKNGTRDETVPLATHTGLVNYLKANPDYRIVQHGCHHDVFEFDCSDPKTVWRRLEAGTNALRAAGFDSPRTFVAPHDRLSRASYLGVAARFQVLSTGWFELRRIPRSWWPQYLIKKLRKRPHWRVGNTVLLTHPGCLLSYLRPYGEMLQNIRQRVGSQELTVLVTHWWEYFRDGQEDKPFIEQLHATADFLAGSPDIEVIAFDDLATGRVVLN